MKKREKSDDAYLKQLGKRIKELRRERGIKQVDLSYACDMDKQNMNRIEAGNTNPAILTLKKICENLDITLTHLLDF